MFPESFKECLYWLLFGTFCLMWLIVLFPLLPFFWAALGIGISSIPFIMGVFAGFGYAQNKQAFGLGLTCVGGLLLSACFWVMAFQTFLPLLSFIMVVGVTTMCGVGAYLSFRKAASSGESVPPRSVTHFNRALCTLLLSTALIVGFLISAPGALIFWLGIAIGTACFLISGFIGCQHAKNLDKFLLGVLGLALCIQATLSGIVWVTHLALMGGLLSASLLMALGALMSYVGFRAVDSPVHQFLWRVFFVIGGMAIILTAILLSASAWVYWSTLVSGSLVLLHNTYLSFKVSRHPFWFWLAFLATLSCAILFFLSMSVGMLSPLGIGFLAVGGILGTTSMVCFRWAMPVSVIIDKNQSSQHPHTESQVFRDYPRPKLESSAPPQTLLTSVIEKLKKPFSNFKKTLEADTDDLLSQPDSASHQSHTNPVLKRCEHIAEQMIDHCLLRLLPKDMNVAYRKAYVEDFKKPTEETPLPLIEKISSLQQSLKNNISSKLGFSQKASYSPSSKRHDSPSLQTKDHEYGEAVGIPKMEITVSSVLLPDEPIPPTELSAELPNHPSNTHQSIQPTQLKVRQLNLTDYSDPNGFHSHIKPMIHSPQVSIDNVNVPVNPFVVSVLSIPDKKYALPWEALKEIPDEYLFLFHMPVGYTIHPNPDFLDTKFPENYLYGTKISLKASDKDMARCITRKVKGAVWSNDSPIIQTDETKAEHQTDYKMSPEDRLELSYYMVCFIVHALFVLHKNNMVHRDVQPQNILIHHVEQTLANLAEGLIQPTAKGDRPWIKLADLDSLTHVHPNGTLLDTDNIEITGRIFSPEMLGGDWQLTGEWQAVWMYEYDIASLSDLPNQDLTKAEYGKIYLSERTGEYWVLEKPHGVLLHHKLDPEKIKLKNLKTQLHDPDLKRTLKAEIMKHISTHDSIKPINENFILSKSYEEQYKKIDLKAADCFATGQTIHYLLQYMLRDVNDNDPYKKQLQNLMRGLTQSNPKKRLTIQQATQHAFFNKNALFKKYDFKKGQKQEIRINNQMVDLKHPNKLLFLPVSTRAIQDIYTEVHSLKYSKNQKNKKIKEILQRINTVLKDPDFSLFFSDLKQLKSELNRELKKADLYELDFELEESLIVMPNSHDETQSQFLSLEDSNEAQPNEAEEEDDTVFLDTEYYPKARQQVYSPRPSKIQNHLIHPKNHKAIAEEEHDSFHSEASESTHLPPVPQC